MKSMIRKQERIAPLLFEAVEAQIKIFDLVNQIHNILIEDEDVTEIDRMALDELLENFIIDRAIVTDLTPDDGSTFAEELIEKIQEAGGL
jgi:hypothetical protein